MYLRLVASALMFILAGCHMANRDAIDREQAAPPVIRPQIDEAAMAALIEASRQQREADRLLLSDPVRFQEELGRATRLFDACVDDHIAIYLSTGVAPDLAARTTVAECAPGRWQPIVDLLDRAKSAGVKLDNLAIVETIREQAHRRVVAELENRSI